MKKVKHLMSWGWERRDSERRWMRKKFYAIVVFEFFCGFISGSALHTVETREALWTVGVLFTFATLLSIALAIGLFRQEQR